MKYITWKDIEKDISILSRYLQDTSFDAIYGVPRGGLILGVLLSHRLSIPLIVDQTKITDQTLIVDDIADSGITLSTVPRGKKIVTCWYHRQSSIIPSLWIHEKTKEWITFPWETDSSSKLDRSAGE